MLAERVICPSTSLFANHVFLVKKRDHSWHFCVDHSNGLNLYERRCSPLVVVASAVLPHTHLEAASHELLAHYSPNAMENPFE